MKTNRRFANAEIKQIGTISPDVYDTQFLVIVWEFKSSDYEGLFYTTYKFSGNGDDFWVTIVRFGIENSAFREQGAFTSEEVDHLMTCLYSCFDNTHDSSFTLMRNDGTFLGLTVLRAFRWASDARPPSLYWRQKNGAFLVVSEPLDEERVCWQEVPPGCALTAYPNGEIRTESLCDAMAA